MCGNNLGSDVSSAEKMFDSLPHCASLTELDVSQNCLDAHVCAHLSSAIARTGNLVLLNLSKNPLGHVGGCCLAYGAQHCTSLKQLHLAGTQIGKVSQHKVWSYVGADGKLVNVDVNMDIPDAKEAAGREFPLGKVSQSVALHRHDSCCNSGAIIQQEPHYVRHCRL